MAVLSEPIAVVGTTVPDTWFTGTQAAVGPADAGALSLTVVDAADFDEGGGTLAIGDDPATAEIVDYTTVDDDTEIITLETALAATWPEMTRVALYPTAKRKYAEVMVGDSGEAVEVEIPHELWNKIADGIRNGGHGEVVEIQLVDDEATIVNIIGQEPQVDGGYLQQETTPPETFMDGSLYGMVGFVGGGLVAGDPLGANTMMSAAGFTADDPDGQRTFQVDALTGAVSSVGFFASGLVPDEAHIVMGDLAGSGASKSFVYFYTGEELNPDGTPVTGAFPGQVASGIDATDGTRYIELRSPDLSTVHPGILTLSSSVDLPGRPNLEWSGDIRLRGDQGIVYVLDGMGARAPLTIEGSALVLDVPNGTMRLGDSGSGGNRLRSRDNADTVRRHLELEAETIMFDVAGCNLVLREAPGLDSYGQLRAFNGNVALLWGATDRIRVTNTAGDGYQPIAASEFQVNSDARVKTNLVAIDPAAALDAVSGLTVYDFTRTDNDRKARGLVAQDVEAVLPMAVDTTDPGSLSIELGAVVGTHTAALQALTARLETVEAKTDKLPTPPSTPAPKAK